MLELLSISFLIVRRHWAIYRKDFFANISPTIVEPVFFILSMGLGLGSYVSDVQGQTYARYLAPGLVMSSAMFTAFFESSYNVYIRYHYDKSYQAMLTTPIGVREIIIGELMWVAIKGAAMSLAVTLILSVFGVVDWSAQVLLVTPVIGSIIGLACGALGIIATTFVRNINQFQTVYTVLITPMFFFSGIFFPVQDLPSLVAYAAFLSPLYYGVRLSQTLFWDENVIQIFPLYFPALIAFCFVLIAIAYPRLRKMLFH